MGPTNPETSSKIDIEDDGDYTVTFSMTLPGSNDTDPNPPYDPPTDHTWTTSPAGQ